MRRHLLQALCVSSFVLLFAGCQRADENVNLNVIEANATALPPPKEFSQTRDCKPHGQYNAPVMETRYVYRRHDGSFSQRQIMSTDQGIVGFRYQDLSKEEQKPLPTRHAIAGLLVTYVEPGSPRRIAYEGDPVREISRLGFGQTLRIPTVETSKLNGRDRRVAFPTTVTYRMCGDLEVAGERMPVRVYSIGSARRVIDRKNVDHVRQGVVTYYLSDQTGYPLVIQDETTTVVDRILPASQ